MSESEIHDRSIRLLRLSRQSFIPDHIEDADRLVGDLRWLARHQNSDVEQLIPLIVKGARQRTLWHRLDTGDRQSLETARLQLAVMTGAQRNLLTRLITRFEATGVPIILLKGSAFLGTLYSRDTPRTAGDIDVLVRKSQFTQACEAVETLGCDLYEFPNRRLATFINHDRAYITKDGDRTLIEVHRLLINPFIFRIEEQNLWQSSLPHPDFEGDAVRILSWEHNLLHLAIHSYRHLSTIDHGLVDAHELICQKSPDWDELIRTARAWGATFALFLLLKSAASILGTPVPPYVLDRLRPSHRRERLAETLYHIKLERELRLGQATYRATQFLAQLVIPDDLLRVLAFQSYYGAIRLLDWVDHRALRK